MKWDEIDKKLTGLADEIHDSYFLKDFIYRKGEFVVPAENNGDSDFGDWQPLDFEVLHRNQGIIWLRTVYTVPEQMMGVPLQGTQLRVNADYFPYFAPTEIYVNRTLRLKENAWMDFNCPEVILSQQAQPGEQFEILLRFDMRDKSFWNIDFRFCIIPESLEEMEFQLRSIVEELNYLQGLPCAQSYLPAAYELLEDCTFPALMHAIEQCRQLFLPVESEIKKRTVYLVGHAHIDMNWFWPMEETRAIVGRDFDTMTRLMEENPEFKFSQSQCATYQMAQEYYPDVFERMKEFVQKGQWDITASTWVENDMNMSDGESIARHMLYSKQYIQKHFGVSPKIMWCPDTFGHSANTPQMLNRAGIRYYFQTRCGIGVNDTPFENKTYTRDAHHVPIYWWRGMDGSKVLSINNIYTQDITTRGIVKLAARMADGFGIDKSMFVYGTGDHGGGPTRRDLKKIQLLRSFPTMPSLKFSTTEEFYTMIEEEYGDILPVRDGEMNFVFDGCYTSHSDVKQENRFCENALESSETLSVAAMLKGLPYDSEAYEQAWRRTLFNQFHDIFDGCGVEDTYRFTNAQAEQVMQFTAASNAKALAHLGGGEAELCGNIKACIAFNPTGWERLEPFTVPCPSNAAGWMAVDSEGRELPVQKVADDLWITLPLPALGHRTFLLKEMAEAKPAPTGIAQNETHFLVETPYWSVEIKKSTGQITTLFDKRENRYVVRKEVINWRLQNGTLNTLQLHYEEPTHYSAWTLGNITRTENLHNASSSILADGPVVKILRFIHDTAEGQICQDIRIYMDNPRIDFVTEVDWKGYGYFDRDAPMLRVSFSPDVRNADAVYDIPFGALHRPCKDNEYPAQKWVDISDGGYGFSVLNNCKYGHKVMGNRVELDLLRSPWHPDRYSAVGKHTFVYSILPHAGNYTAGETVKHACFLNQPSLVGQLPTVCADSPAPQFGLLIVENQSIVVAAVKKAETGGDVILRLYNSAECEITSAISLHFPTTAIVEADLLENPTGKCLACDGTFTATMYPFEIKTYRISLKTDAGT